MNSFSNTSILSDDLTNKLDFYRERFDAAEPFRHVLIEPFFDPGIAEAMLEEFPVPAGPATKNAFGGSNRKYARHDVRSIGPTYRLIDDYISSPKFALEMERLTGIKGLLYEAEYHGAGTHENLSGQGLDVHVDFNLHPRTGYHRRCNAIIYLNKEWEEGWGGNLEIHKNPWDFENDTFVSYPPLFNHCVLFETNEYSWHGFKRVQHPDGRQLSRKSFTFYMYTEERPDEEVAPKHGTIYVQSGPPKHFTPGYTLSKDDVKELKQEFKRRNSYLQGMYDRESRLLVQVAATKTLRTKLRIPTIGYVRQAAAPVGVDIGSSSVSDVASFSYMAVRPIEALTLRAHLPRHVARLSLACTINGRLHSTEHVDNERVFEHRFPAVAERGNPIDMKIEVQGLELNPEAAVPKHRGMIVIDEIQFD